jgi:hypothetical protein
MNSGLVANTTFEAVFANQFSRSAKVYCIIVFRKFVLSRCTLQRPVCCTQAFLLYTTVARAGIFKNSMGARNRGEIGLSYRPAGKAVNREDKRSRR